MKNSQKEGENALLQLPIYLNFQLVSKKNDSKAKKIYEIVLLPMHGAAELRTTNRLGVQGSQKKKCDVFVPSVAQGTASVGSPSQAEAVGLFMQWRCLNCVAHDE